MLTVRSPASSKPLSSNGYLRQCNIVFSASVRNWIICAEIHNVAYLKLFLCNFGRRVWEWCNYVCNCIVEKFKDWLKKIALSLNLSEIRRYLHERLKLWYFAYCVLLNYAICQKNNDGYVLFDVYEIISYYYSCFFYYLFMPYCTMKIRTNGVFSAIRYSSVNDCVKITLKSLLISKPYKNIVTDFFLKPQNQNTISFWFFLFIAINAKRKLNLFRQMR